MIKSLLNQRFVPFNIHEVHIVMKVFHPATVDD